MYESYRHQRPKSAEVLAPVEASCTTTVREPSFFDRFGLDDILLILLLILLFQQDEKDYLAMIAVGYLFFCGL